MTNSAFQGGGKQLNTLSALAIHLLWVVAKAVKKTIIVTSALKGGVSHLCVTGVI